MPHGEHLLGVLLVSFFINLHTEPLALFTHYCPGLHIIST